MPSYVKLPANLCNERSTCGKTIYWSDYCSAHTKEKRRKYKPGVHTRGKPGVHTRSRSYTGGVTTARFDQGESDHTLDRLIDELRNAKLKTNSNGDMSPTERFQKETLSKIERDWLKETDVSQRQREKRQQRLSRPNTSDVTPKKHVRAKTTDDIPAAVKSVRITSPPRTAPAKGEVTLLEKRKPTAPASLRKTKTPSSSECTHTNAFHRRSHTHPEYHHSCIDCCVCKTTEQNKTLCGIMPRIHPTTIDKPGPRETNPPDYYVASHMPDGHVTGDISEEYVNNSTYFHDARRLRNKHYVIHPEFVSETGAELDRKYFGRSVVGSHYD